MTPTQGRLAEDVDYFARTSRLDVVLLVVKDDLEVADLPGVVDSKEVRGGEERRFSENGVAPLSAIRSMLHAPCVALVLPDHAVCMHTERAPRVIADGLQKGQDKSAELCTLTSKRWSSPRSRFPMGFRWLTAPPLVRQRRSSVPRVSLLSC